MHFFFLWKICSYLLEIKETNKNKREPDKTAKANPHRIPFLMRIIPFVKSAAVGIPCICVFCVLGNYEKRKYVVLQTAVLYRAEKIVS